MKPLTQKTYLIIVIIAVCLIGLLLLLLQLRSTQTVRSRATGEAISFSLTPSTQNILLGQTAEYTLMLNAYTNIITGVDITVKFDPTLIQDALWTSSPSGLSTVLHNGDVNLTDGTLRYAAVEISNPNLTSTFPLGTIRLTSKALGTGSLSLLKSQVTAQGLNTALPITQMSPAQYVIAAPTPTSVLGNVTGKIADSSGTGIANSKVAITNNGVKKSTTTNSFGMYSITGLKPGTYQMTVSAKQYTTVKTSFTVYSNQVTTKNVTLLKR